MSKLDRCAKRIKTAALKDKRLKWIQPIVFGLLSLFLIPLSSCNTESIWTTDDVKVTMSVTTVSAGFIECTFSTNKEAYYLIAIEPVQEGVNPMEHQKQFMTLALDSAYADYLMWRSRLLKEGEFNIAPFASHTLHYGSEDYFFTGLWPETTYWVYAFVVNPETLKPTGALYLQTVTTKDESIMDIHFDYRVKGRWDYIYPMDTLGNIYGRFPYIATTLDSLTLAEEDSLYTQEAAALYLYLWCLARFTDPSEADVLYGVHAVENDGYQSSEYWQEGHTYYTAICGYDGSFKQMTIYKFLWTGDSCNYYFRDTDSANIAVDYH